MSACFGEAVIQGGSTYIVHSTSGYPILRRGNAIPRLTMIPILKPSLSEQVAHIRGQGVH